MATAGIPILEVKHLKVQFLQQTQGDFTAVEDLNFSLLKGETLGILGESGSGKSVTALALTGLLPANARIEGHIRLENSHLSLPTAFASLQQSDWLSIRGKKIAMIFQEPMTALNPVLSCGEQINEVLMRHQKPGAAEARSLAMDWLAKVKLPNPERIYKSFPHELSGGQKQRVMIAIALSCRPDILIADEPTTALDVTVQQTILDLLRELQQELGLSIVFITHDLGVLASIAHRVIVMRKGLIVESGQIQSLLQHPHHPYTRGLIACRPPLAHKMYRLPVVDDFLTIETYDSVKAHIPLSAQDLDQRRKQLAERPAILQVEELCTWFGHRPFLPWRQQNRQWVKAVDNVSFAVQAGETLGLVGESGSGKTTLGRTILRLVEPRQGKVWYQQQEFSSAEEEGLKSLRRQVQMIFQDPYSSFNPRMTVGEAIAEPMEVHQLGLSKAERKDKVLSLLQQVGLLPEYYQRFPHQFSGGQRQRLCIARALAVDPQVVICDECVSALDVSVQAQILNLLKELQEERGLTYLFISHDLSVVRFMSDRIAVMKEGKIVELADAEEIYQYPKEDYTRQLWQAVPGRR